MLVVTTEGIPGYEVSQVIGEVLGVAVRSNNPFIEGIKTLNGRTNPQMARLFVQIRQEAVANMEEYAHRRGANAVIGLHFDNRAVTSAWNELCAYGTAVVVVPVGGGEPPSPEELDRLNPPNRPELAAELPPDPAAAPAGGPPAPAYRFRTTY